MRFKPELLGLMRWGPVGVWSLLIFWLSSLPHLATSCGLWDFVLRKMAHLFEYAVLGILWALALKEKKGAPMLALLSSGIYAISDEIHQAFVPGRGPATMDTWIDIVGAFVGVLVWERLKKQRVSPSSHGPSRVTEI